MKDKEKVQTGMELDDDNEAPSNPNTKEKPDTTTTTTQQSSSCSESWTFNLLKLHHAVTSVLLTVSRHAALHPIKYIVGIIILSVGMAAIGLFTNFTADIDEDALWTPFNGRAIAHRNWIDRESGFPPNPRYFSSIIHANGANLLDVNGQEQQTGEKAISRAFEYIDLITSLPDFDGACGADCRFSFVTQFWNHNSTLFEEQQSMTSSSNNNNSSSSPDIIDVISGMTLPDGKTLVDPLRIYGQIERDNSTQRLTYISTFILELPLLNLEISRDFESVALDACLNLRREWKQNEIQLECFSSRSVGDEFTRAIIKDIPLIPAAFCIMSFFTALVFFRPHWVYSRSLLGVGAVVSVFLSIMTGYGLLFLCAVPLTSMTQILPFVVFGIGLDDAFIITGAFRRTDKTKDLVERIHHTIEEVGVSILLTTITSTLAFGLGCTSSIPAVYWLCLYAFPTIFFVFVYQLTFFVALIVVDERRVQAKRRDCLVCLSVKSTSTEDENDSEEQNDHDTRPDTNIIDRFMVWYADFLLKPWVKAFVIVGFIALTAVSAYGASKLGQAFDLYEVLPADSYVPSYLDSAAIYGRGSTIAPSVYFRSVDQGDSLIQDQMEDYVNELVALDQITLQPAFFWLRDFRNFTQTNETLVAMPFAEQVDAFLSVPSFSRLYSGDMVRDEEGNVIESRVLLHLDQVSIQDVQIQIEAQRSQRGVSESAPINQGKSDWAFFSYEGIYLIWDFYIAAPYELTLSTIYGVGAVSALALIFIPHWTAVIFVLPLISILYIDLLGILQYAGISLNAVSYISLVMAIGLLVDFLMHVLLRYFESKEKTREAKVKDTLSSIGSSILLGGISTFLGVVPLAFSVSTIFRTIFIAFLALVTLGLGHGLILLPVLLSLVGTTDVLIRKTTNDETPSPSLEEAMEERVRDDDSEMSA